MRQLSLSLDGSHGSPESVHVYANKPLPPLPPPTLATAIPGKVMKKPLGNLSKSLSSMNLRDGARFMSPRSAPTSSPAKKSHERQSSYSGPPATGHRSSKKVKQLMGYNVDIMDDSSAFWTRRPGSGLSMSSTSSHSLQDLSSSYQSDYVFGRPDDMSLPMLESDVDGRSSRDSTWEPPSPHPGMYVPLGIDTRGYRYSNEFRRSHSSTGSYSPVEMDMPARWDPAYGQFSDSNVADEYHKIAVELATQEEEEKKKKKSSTIAQRKYRKATSPGGLATIPDHPPQQTPGPDAAPIVPTGPASAKGNMQSAFDVDSDDEEDTRRESSRTSWRKDAASSSEWPSMQNVRRRMEEMDRSKWSKTGDQMKDLFGARRRRAKTVK